jgi:DNA invertase Pin-like site-specific DNA recombinase
MTGKKIGYVRVSSLDQNTSRQLDGVDVDITFEEKASGKDTNRPKLDEMLTFVRIGDEVCVHSMDRLARTLSDLKSLVETITKKGATIKFIKEGLSFTGDDNAMAHFTLSMMGAFAEFERDKIRERQREGITLAKQKGVYKGGLPKLSKNQMDEIQNKIASGITKTRIAQDLNISRQTVYAYAKKAITT